LKERNKLENSEFDSDEESISDELLCTQKIKEPESPTS
jgi:hypothetical protein